MGEPHCNNVVDDDVDSPSPTRSNHLILGEDGAEEEDVVCKVDPHPHKMKRSLKKEEEKTHLFFSRPVQKMTTR